MTPFGAKLRELRSKKGLSQKQMAGALNVTAAYLSALEHGRRAAPSFDFVQRVIGYFNVIWDDAEELQRLASISNPRVSVDTSGLSPQATELANLLAIEIGSMRDSKVEKMLLMLKSKDALIVLFRQPL
jgi:transcriptional regulator with XRE-family HTH domain